MKKIILPLITVMSSLLFSFNLAAQPLEVGKKAPDWLFQDSDRKEFSMNSWTGKVLQINYVDPDVSDLNDAYNDAVNRATDVDKRIDQKLFKGIGIVDCKSTWKPNSVIRLIAGNKAKKYDTTILFDYDGVLQKKWGMPEDNYTIVIVDKNRICRAIYKGKVPDSEIEKIIQLIITLTKE